MQTRFLLPWLGLSVWIAGCGSGATANVATTTTTVVTTAGAPAWTRISLPSALSASGASYSVQADGYLYAVGPGDGSSGVGNYVERTLASSPGSWTNITGGLSSVAESLAAVGMMPNGTILVAGLVSGGGTADVFWWNGSTSSPAWTKVTGWTGVSSSRIYQFGNDSAGYTYFSPAYSGDIWRNDAPNSTNFTRVAANLYGVTNGGATGHATYGGLFVLNIFNLNDGKGDMMWACGEGELDDIGLSFSAASNTAYLTTAAGYSGNCTGLDKSATTILGLRQASPSLDAGYDTLTGINIATRAATVHVSTYPRTGSTFPGDINMNAVGGLHWMAGTNWIASVVDAKVSTLTYLLLSTDDGNTWTDITASGGIDSSCTGTNMSVGAAAMSHYVFARCQNGTVLWEYGPV